MGVSNLPYWKHKKQHNEEMVRGSVMISYANVDQECKLLTIIDVQES